MRRSHLVSSQLCSPGSAAACADAQKKQSTCFPFAVAARGPVTARPGGVSSPLWAPHTHQPISQDMVLHTFQTNTQPLCFLMCKSSLPAVVHVSEVAAAERMKQKVHHSCITNGKDSKSMNPVGLHKKLMRLAMNLQSAQNQFIFKLNYSLNH